MPTGVRLRASDGRIEIFFDPSDLVRKSVVDEHNSVYAVDALDAWFSLLADSPLPFPMNRKPKVLYRKWKRQLLSRPLVDTIREYAGLANRLLTQEAIHHEGPVERIFLVEFKDTPIFKEYHKFYVTGDKRLLRYIYSFLIFLKKARFERDDLNATAFREWLQVEKRLASQSIDLDVCADLRAIIGTLLPKPDYDLFYPKHGPGQVSEGVGRYVDEKHRLSFLDRKGTRLFSSVIHPLDNRAGYATLHGNHAKKVVSHATLRFVPKDITKTRSICMEPASRMYLQQGILKMLVHAISVGDLGKFITIHDQTRNQRLAQGGSTFLHQDTIDLSSASDSVGWDLVKEIFPTPWLRLFAATRSSTVEHEGTLYNVLKFAPMGSAVCFPTQCIVFFSILVLCSMRYKYHRTCGFTPDEIRATVNGYTATPYDRRISEPSVYGDDIICDTRITDDVIQMLRSLRFTVNEEKSFISSQTIRESCGKFYHEGEDFSPIRFTMPFHKGKVSPKAIASLVEGTNYALSLGFANLRRWFMRQALYKPVNGIDKGTRKWRFRDKSGRLKIAFTSDPDEFGFLCQRGFRIHNSHLSYKRMTDWQRGGWQSLSIGSTKKPINEQHAHERYSYSLYWRAKTKAEDLTRQGHAVVLPEDTRFVWGWTPKQ